MLPALAVVLVLSAGAYLMVPMSPSNGPGTPLAHASVPSAHASSMLSTGPVHMTAARPAANASFNPPCFPLNATLCISVSSPSTPNIIPIPPNHNAPYMPNATDNITLYLKSQYNLQFPNAPPNGPKSPIAINLTGVLWDGDPYFCTCDGSVWHANSASTNGGTWWSAPAALQGINKTYPFWYVIQIVPRNQFGQPQFFAGETVTWYMYIVSYDTKHTSYSGTQVGPTFSYRIAGAWPFSPWPGAVQYAGPNAPEADLTLHWSPLVPNWNDSIVVTIQLTAASVTNRTLIGFPTTAINPYVRLTEKLPNGTPLVQNATYLFPTIEGAPGASILNLTLPPTLTQVAGSNLTFQVTAQDGGKNELNSISLTPVTITINGNGSFPTGVFPNDLLLNTTTNGRVLNITLASQSNTTVIGPGVNVTVTLQTRSLSTSIQSAEILYSFYYSALGETAQAVLPMVRVNSTAFRVNIPSMPLGSVINFTVEALDYSHHLDISSLYGYRTQTLSQWVTVIPENETFFFIYVFNNQTQTYLSGAQVDIREAQASGYNTMSSTRFGVAYPNATGNDYLPLLVPANQTYNITVTPNPGVSVISAGHLVNVQFLATGQNAIAREHRTLAKGIDYIVLQEGSSIYFWLNGSLPSTVYAPNQGNAGPTLVAGIIGLAGAAVVSVVVWLWFRDVQARRKAEEKRVTL
jgi:hypothetical protein